MTHRKKRSIILHCTRIGFDFTQFVDSCFRNLMTNFLPLSSLLDVLIIYLTEGIKGLYRLTYAIAKHNKAFIKTISDKGELMSKLGQECKRVMPGTHHVYLKHAFAYPLGAATRHRFSQQQVTAMMSQSIRKDKISEMIDYLPNAPLRSSLIDYQTYAHLWMMVPPYMRIRIP